jgi:hypothetical protein
MKRRIKMIITELPKIKYSIKIPTLFTPPHERSRVGVPSTNQRTSNDLTPASGGIFNLALSYNRRGNILPSPGGEG